MTWKLGWRLSKGFFLLMLLKIAWTMEIMNCTKYLADADANGDNRLNQTEFFDFIKSISCVPPDNLSADQVKLFTALACACESRGGGEGCCSRGNAAVNITGARNMTRLRERMNLRFTCDTVVEILEKEGVEIFPFCSPTDYPSETPSIDPSEIPSEKPSVPPSNEPTPFPSEFPSRRPSPLPSLQPSPLPSPEPSPVPSDQPSNFPTISNQPTASHQPTTTTAPSSKPSISAEPSAPPTNEPTNPPVTRAPVTRRPTLSEQDMSLPENPSTPGRSNWTSPGLNLTAPTKQPVRPVRTNAPVPEGGNGGLGVFELEPTSAPKISPPVPAPAGQTPSGTPPTVSATKNPTTPADTPLVPAGPTQGNTFSPSRGRSDWQPPDKPIGSQLPPVAAPTRVPTKAPTIKTPTTKAPSITNRNPVQDPTNLPPSQPAWIRETMAPMEMISEAPSAILNVKEIPTVLPDNKRPTTTRPPFLGWTRETLAPVEGGGITESPSNPLVAKEAPTVAPDPERACVQQMAIADANNDQELSKQEFINFAEALGSCNIGTTMPSQLNGAFQTLACLCVAANPTEPLCCALNPAVSITGAYFDAADRTVAQQANLLAVCQTTRYAITSGGCGNGGGGQPPNPVVVTRRPSKAPTAKPFVLVTNKPTPTPTASPTEIFEIEDDFLRCTRSLVSADENKDGYLSRGEYIMFTRIYSNCNRLYTLTNEQDVVFLGLACECIIAGESPICCLPDIAQVAIRGAALQQSQRTAAQRSFLRVICQTTSYIPSCSEIPGASLRDPPTPAPSPYPSAILTIKQVCEESLLPTADQNDDEFLSRDEFTNLVRDLSPCDIKALTQQQSALFETLACQCENAENAIPDCCTGTNARVSIAGSNTPLLDRTDAQNIRLASICQSIRATIVSQCEVETAAPAERPVPVVPPPTPTTRAPVTRAPVTASPVTASPVTPSPVTASPVTASPVTASPITASPITAAPITSAPLETDSTPAERDPTEGTDPPLQTLPIEPPPIPVPSASPTVVPTARPTAVPTTTPTSAPTSTPTTTPTATPTDMPTTTPIATPTTVPTEEVEEDVEFLACTNALAAADRNSDRLLNINEYLRFIIYYSGCGLTTELTEGQEKLFTELACLCLTLEGASINCCLPKNAMIDIDGAAIAENNRRAEQNSNLRLVCSSVDNILPGVCVAPGFEPMPTPGPTPKPSVAPTLAPQTDPLDSRLTVSPSQDIGSRSSPPTSSFAIFSPTGLPEWAPPIHLPSSSPSKASSTSAPDLVSVNTAAPSQTPVQPISDKCRESLLASDRDSDGNLFVDEYLDFIRIFSDCDLTTELSPEQETLFRTLSIITSCPNQDVVNCFSSRMSVSIQGVNLSERARTPIQSAHLYQICSDSFGTIGDECVPSPTVAPRISDNLDECTPNMVIADANQDGLLNVTEYTTFIREYSNCSLIDSLDLGQQATFQALACDCMKETGTYECCLYSNARLNITGAELNNDLRAASQITMLSRICDTASPYAKRECVPPPTRPPGGDLCSSQLVLADKDSDNFLDIDEYLEFMKQQYEDCNAIESLSLSQWVTFNLLACFCLRQPGATIECCSPKNAKVSIDGASLLQEDRSYEQRNFLTIICMASNSTVSIGCRTLPPSPAPHVVELSVEESEEIISAPTVLPSSTSGAKSKQMPFFASIFTSLISLVQMIGF